MIFSAYLFYFHFYFNSLYNNNRVVFENKYWYKTNYKTGMTIGYLGRLLELIKIKFYLKWNEYTTECDFLYFLEIYLFNKIYVFQVPEYP